MGLVAFYGPARRGERPLFKQDERTGLYVCQLCNRTFRRAGASHARPHMRRARGLIREDTDGERFYYYIARGGR